MLKSNNYKFEFRSSFFWNSIDSVLAQGLVTIHHILLKVFWGPEFHGLFASYISIIYTCIPIFNFGFDYSLSTHLKDFTQTKKNFLSMLTFQFLPQLLFTGLIISIILQPSAYRLFFNHAPTPEITWLKYIFIIEYIRKSARSFLQLSLHSKTTTFVEIGGTLFYMAIFWLATLFSQSAITVLFACKLLAFSAFIQVILLAIKIFQHYLSLNQAASSSTNDLAKVHLSIAKSRFGICANHIISQINYSNFIIPFSSICFGTSQASFLVILMNSARCITLFFQKGLGISSLALLSQSKDEKGLESESILSYPISYLYNLSIPLFVFFLINSSKLSYLFSDNKIAWHLASLACILSVTEGAISVYEKFYIAKKKIHLFSIVNSIGSIALFILSYKFGIFSNLITFFLCFFFVRITSLIAIILCSHHYLKLISAPSFNTHVLWASFILSGLFYLLF